MYFNMITRKMFRVLWTRHVSSKRERTPSSLHECFDVSKDRKCNSRRWLILLVVAPILFFTFLIGVTSQEMAFPIRSRRLLNDQTIRVILSEEIREAMKQNETGILRLSGFKHITVTTSRSPLNILPLCVLNKTKYGPITLYKQNKLKAAEIRYHKIKMGGYYVPDKCQPRHKVGILVPYRNRKTNLADFLFNIHPFLMNQKLEYQIFIIEQSGTEPFNRGRLFNAGFVEMQKYGKWHCVILHDVDLLPMDSRILYTCPTFPRHMCAVVTDNSKRPNSKTRTFTGRPTFGGVSSMTMQQFFKVNGFSNRFWGWGGEDTDMFWRLRHTGLPVVRYDKKIARYFALPHETPSSPNPYRYKIMRNLWRRHTDDGLSNVEYKVVSVATHPLYTQIVVDINPYQENITELNLRWSQAMPVFKLPQVIMDNVVNNNLKTKQMPYRKIHNSTA